jgi:hypothetical protein
MGIAAPDTDPGDRSKLANATVLVVVLLFFFGVGLAGGAAYKAYFGDDASPQVAGQVSPPPAPASPAAPPQNFAADTPSTAEKATSDLARTEPPAPPALTPPPAPTVAEQPERPPAPALAQAAPPAPSVPEPAPQAALTEPPAVPAAETAPSNADTQPETQAAEPVRVTAVAPQKPAMVTKAHRDAPRTAATQPSARGNTVGSYRVQFGAFAQEDNARHLQSAIAATGLKVEISQAPGPSGHSLFFVRSPPYPDYASASSAAQTAHDRAHLDYAIRADHSAPEQQEQR